MFKSIFFKKLFFSTKTMCVLFFFTSLIFSSNKSVAQGGLLITPQRVVFDGEKRIEELNLANTGNDTTTYNISFKQIRMTEDGLFEEIAEPDQGQNFAHKYLRFFPRRVTLAPKEAQVVKIQVVKDNLLVDGEYRSHVYFRPIVNITPLGDPTVGANDANDDIAVNLTPVFGITIPIIIQRGESTAKVELSILSLNLEEKIPVLQILFNRTGNMSVYGDVTVDYVSPEGEIIEVGKVRGIAVYTPTLKRKFNVRLNKTKGVDFGKGMLHVTYKTNSDIKPTEKLAETELILN